MTNDHFFELLAQVTSEKASYLCAGFDPVGVQADMLLSEGRDFLDDVCESVAVVKFNMAFFEACGAEGLKALQELIREAHGMGLLVILDAKRGDVEHTNRMHAKVVFDLYGADAVTLHPYMGLGALKPFEEKGGCFVLCLTSNEDAGHIQDKYLDIVENSTMGLVMGTRDDSLHLHRMREARSHTDEWFLTPGVGAQGGVLEDTVKALYTLEPKFLLSMSRSLQSGGHYRKAEQARVDINKALCKEGLEHVGAIKRGEYTLKSGEKSDLYCDMRVLASHPELRGLVARSLWTMEYGAQDTHRQLIAVPTGGLVIGMELSSLYNHTLRYLHNKDHGDAKGLVGAPNPSVRECILVDDVITSGGSIRESLSRLAELGVYPRRILCIVNRSGMFEIEDLPITSLFTEEDFR